MKTTPCIPRRSFAKYGLAAAPSNRITFAVRTGGAVAFDPKTMHVANNPDADALLRLKYYNGWSL